MWHCSIFMVGAVVELHEIADDSSRGIFTCSRVPSFLPSAGSFAEEFLKFFATAATLLCVSWSCLSSALLAAHLFLKTKSLALFYSSLLASSEDTLQRLKISFEVHNLHSRIAYFSLHLNFYLLLLQSLQSPSLLHSCTRYLCS